MKKLSYNLIHLKYFFDAVMHGSVSASAKANFVSQSAISQGIKKLEKCLGCALIVHKPNRFHVTDDGKKLFESSQDVFCALKAAENSFFTEEHHGKLSFACTHSFALALLPEHLMRSHELYPSLQINFRLAHAFTIMDLVKKGSIDFGILLDNVDLSPFHCEPIYHGQYRLYVSDSSPDPSKLSFLLDTEERMETNLLKKCYKARYGKELPVLMEISSWEVIATLTEEGLGIGLFPDYIAKRHPNLKPYSEDLVQIPYTIYAIFANTREKGIHVTRFLKLLQQAPECELASLQYSALQVR